MKKAVRMADIAERLNISVVSVSKALAGKSGVSEEMRAKVVALAREMGYEASRPRGELAMANNIGVLVSDRFFDDSAFYSSLYRALVMACGEEGFTCMVEIVSQEAERGAEEPAIVAGRKVDGIIFMGNLAPDYLRAVAGRGLPCLLLDFHAPHIDMDCIVSDNIEGGFAMTEHLLAQGCREIGFVGSIRSTSSIMDRYLGYQRALRTACIVPREEWLLEDRDSCGRIIPLQLPETLPQAFVCNCDEAAFHLVELLQKRGVRVPEDVAVCGYDDYRFALLCRPQLTTYRVNVEQMAKAAVDRILEKIRQGGSTTVRYTVPGEIIVRESSKRAGALTGGPENI